MAITWSVQLVLSESQSLCPGMCHAKFHIAWFILKTSFVKINQNMALYGQNMVLTWSLKLVLPESKSIGQGIFHAEFHIAECIL